MVGGKERKDGKTDHYLSRPPRPPKRKGKASNGYSRSTLFDEKKEETKRRKNRCGSLVFHDLEDHERVE